MFKTLKRSIIGYKKIRNGKVLKLQIPKGARVHFPDKADNTTKCRASVAIPLAVRDITFTSTCRSGKWRKASGYETLEAKWYDGKIYYYILGVEARPLHPFSRKNEVCASGIHFFLKYLDARDY